MMMIKIAEGNTAGISVNLLITKISSIIKENMV